MKRGPKPLPAVKESDRLYGDSGYTGVNATELSRRAGLARDVAMTEEMLLVVCDRLVQGEPLVLICADLDMPSTRQFMRYLFKNEEARATYYTAKEMQAETLLEELNSIAADDSNDFSVDRHGRRTAHNDVVQRARLKMDALKWTITKNAPKRYGDKSTTEIQGNSDKPVVITVDTGIKRKPGSLIGGEIAAPKIIEAVAIKEPVKDE